jgi:hypothetical protein
MADRYLLESGAPDGYLLEDGSGVLLLDAVTGPQIREIVSAWSNSAQITLNLSLAEIGDTVLLIHADNFYTLANLNAPGGTAVSSWAEQTGTGIPVDGGTNDNHARVWKGTVTAEVGTVATSSDNTDHERYAVAVVYIGAVEIDDLVGTETDTAGTSHAAPSVTPDSGAIDDSLVCVWGTTDAETNYTVPGSMTPDTEYDTGFNTYRAATEKLASDAATGTRTAASSVSTTWFAISVIVKSPGAGGVALDGIGPAAASATGALDAARPLDGTGPAAGSGTGSASVTRPLTGIGSAAALATGALSRGRPLTGIGPTAASATGTVDVGRGLTGIGSAAAHATGDLTVTPAAGGAVALDGIGSAAASSTGVLSTDRSLDGTGSAAGSATGVLSSLRPLDGTGSAAADASGALTVARALDGVAPAVADASGELTVTGAAVVPLDGVGSAAAAMVGDLSVERALDGAGHAAASLVGSLSVLPGPIDPFEQVATAGFDPFESAAGSGTDPTEPVASVGFDPFESDAVPSDDPFEPSVGIHFDPFEPVS